MPELPEVETVVSGIRSDIINKCILDVHVYHQRLRHPIQKDLKDKLIGKSIQQVRRRAKYIIINVGYDVIIHLGMSGKLVLKEKDYIPKKHDHIIIQFEDLSLVFNDQRRFGMFYYTDNADKNLSHLSIEPLSEAFSAEYLYPFVSSGHNIKQRIMDQNIVVGVGNIYAQEALYTARISPLATHLTKKQCQLLVEAIKLILNAAIEKGGTTLKDYRTPKDTLGYFQQTLQVYNQKQCPKGHEVTKIKQSGRSTSYCKYCQNSER